MLCVGSIAAYQCLAPCGPRPKRNATLLPWLHLLAMSIHMNMNGKI